MPEARRKQKTKKDGNVSGMQRKHDACVRKTYCAVCAWRRSGPATWRPRAPGRRPRRGWCPPVHGGAEREEPKQCVRGRVCGGKRGVRETARVCSVMRRACARARRRAARIIARTCPIRALRRGSGGAHARRGAHAPRATQTQKRASVRASVRADARTASSASWLATCASTSAMRLAYSPLPSLCSTKSSTHCGNRSACLRVHVRVCCQSGLCADVRALHSA